MRRAWLRIAAAAAVFAAAAVVGFLAVAHLAPERLRSHLEARLSQDFGAPVRIGAIHLAVRPQAGIRVGLDRVRAGSPGDDLQLRVPEAEVGVDPLALLSGRLQIGRLDLRGAWLRVVGSGAPDPGADPGAGPSASAGPEAEPAERLARAFAGALPFRHLRVSEARLVWLPREGAKPVVLRDLSGELDARRLRLGRTLEVEAELLLGKAAAPFRLAAHTLRAGVAGEIALDDVDLATLVARLPLADAPRLRGRADLHLEWRHEDGADRLLLLASGRDVALPVSAGAPPWRLERPRLRAEIARTSADLRLAFGELDDGSLRLRARGHVARPLGPDAPLELELETDPLPLRGEGSLLAHLPEAWRVALAGLAEPVTAARLRETRLRLHGSARSLRPLAERRLPAPGVLELELAVDDATLRAGEDDRIEDLSGQLRFDGDALELHAESGRFRDSVLPRLDARVQGLAQVKTLDELRCMPPAPAPSLPGLPRAVEWIRSHKRRPGRPSFEGLSLRADWLAHPALLCSIEELTGRLETVPRGLDVEVERAVYAGIPVSGQARYRDPDPASGRDRASLELHLALGPPFEAMAPHPPRDPWARGQFRAGLRRMGPWRLHGADGEFAISGARLELREVDLGLDPAGPVQATATVDLDRAGHLPFEAAFAMQELEAEQVTRSGGVAGTVLSGSLSGAGEIHGELVPHRPPLTTSEGVLSLQAREGHVYRRLPPLLAVATASGSLNPFRSGGELAYEAIDFAGHVEGGRLHSDAVTLYGPTVRMGASGSVGVEKPHPVDAVVGLFLFPGLDAMLDRLPLLDMVLLGPDRNLVGAYFSLGGPFKKPEAKLIPIKSIATGPASLVLERLPGLLFGGLKALRSVIAPPPPPPPASPRSPMSVPPGPETRPEARADG